MKTNSKKSPTAKFFRMIDRELKKHEEKISSLLEVATTTGKAAESTFESISSLFPRTF